MANLQTSFMGLALKNPLMVGSSGLTSTVEQVIELEKQGAAAVVLKSLFEEQILHEANFTLHQDESVNQYPEALDYIKNFSRENAIGNYLDLIRNCKKQVSIPVIASINCFSTGEWISYASRIEEAGADAIELNVFILPSDPLHGSDRNEKMYVSILESVLKQVRIPISLKISYYFSGLAEITRRLDWVGAKGLVLFNRFYSQDIDLEQMKVIPSHVLSEPGEYTLPLRWVALLSDSLNCDLAATTGIHDGKTALKMILAGASAVQVVSSVYRYGPAYLGSMLTEMNDWMDQNGFNGIRDIKGKLSFKKADNHASYERVQFMKHFAGIE